MVETDFILENFKILLFQLFPLEHGMTDFVSTLWECRMCSSRGQLVWTKEHLLESK